MQPTGSRRGVCSLQKSSMQGLSRSSPCMTCCAYHHLEAAAMEHLRELRGGGARTTLVTGSLGGRQVERRSAAVGSPIVSGGRGALCPLPLSVSSATRRRRASGSGTRTRGDEEAAGHRTGAGRVRERTPVAGDMVVGDGGPAAVRHGRGAACRSEGGRGTTERCVC